MHVREYALNGHLFFDEPIDRALKRFDVLWREVTSDEQLTSGWLAVTSRDEEW